MARSSLPLGPALVLAAVVTLAVGAVVYVTIDETAGAIIAALGVFDLVTIPVVLRLMRRNAVRRPTADERETPAQPDRTYNPYARED